MKTPNEIIIEFVQKNELPTDNEFLDVFHDEKGIFTTQENILMDYKDEYPFSNSDSHFAGILRLLCALHNTYGGIVIFGVHDTKRTAGGNKVIVDDEKINRKLRESLTLPFKITCRKYSTPSGDVDVLLVPKRTSTPPVRFIKEISNIEPHLVFYRDGAEVAKATGADLGFLYGMRLNLSDPDFEEDISIEGALPASPSTISELLGRFDVVEKVFRWLQASREARFFIWGDGGSGKSTLAYEIGRIVEQCGKAIKTTSGKQFERVIYLSAKNIYLDPEDSKIKNYLGTDFANSEDLFRAILQLSHYGELDDIENFNEVESLKQIEDLFELETQLIVIDDIDTLTSANEDPGMEQLFSIVARCKSETKLLYTQRNLPLFAKRSSVEVPGLRVKDEFPEFIKSCTRQFSVDRPSRSEMSVIFEESEARPLAIETMIGLRRITSNYEDAINRWKSDKSDALDYLFRREYDALSSDQRGKNLLAAASVFGSPQNQETFQTILDCSKDQIQDAIAETRDMFLTVIGKGAAGSTLYGLRQATHSFLKSVSKELDRFALIEARVQSFQRQSATTPPSLLTLLHRVQRNRGSGDCGVAWSLLTNQSLPEIVRQHHDFKAELGKVAASFEPAKVTEARQAFSDAYNFGHRDYEMYQFWLRLERKQSAGTTNGIDVCNLVLETAGFNLRTKANFRRQLAYLQVTRAMQIQLSAPDDVGSLLMTASINNVLAFKDAKEAEDTQVRGYRDQAEDSITKFCANCNRKNQADLAFDFFDRILETRIEFDDLVDSVVAAVGTLRRNGDKNFSRQIAVRIKRLVGRLSNQDYGVFYSADIRQQFRKSIS